MKKLGGYFVFKKTIFDEKLRGKCLEVSGIIAIFAGRNKSTQSKQVISNEQQGDTGEDKGIRRALDRQGI
jgi:hypothetical protein